MHQEGVLLVCALERRGHAKSRGVGEICGFPAERCLNRDLIALYRGYPELHRDNGQENQNYYNGLKLFRI